MFAVSGTVHVLLELFFVLQFVLFCVLTSVTLRVLCVYSINVVHTVKSISPKNSSCLVI